MENRAKSDMTEVIRRRYDRTSIFYDWMDRMISPELRKKALSQASGKVLEVGAGTGNNFPYYPPGCEVTAIDFSPGMLARARKKLHLARAPIKLLEMDAQAMDFPDNTFDTVVATCVFCSVPDPVKGLAEVKRVCKPNGKIILLEHVRSESPVIGWLMDVLNPISLHLIGSNINRRTVQNVISAGIQLQKVEDLRGKIVKLIVGTP
ncbi:class I SAM-dependent methyltransferase [Biomaibacter acetigenes]|uniref:Class I SAM-dependent methyltransferase n=1 Tax=Biomaibacter acetigenes TaxID=2316383 RepID=A0A3G2RA00_9FIRM|nr:class I SAM-dependent methyltransferase [Biomaibacter acetigenes]